MKLVIFNGSPRKKKSNSTILISHFLNGYNRIIQETVPVHYLAGKRHAEDALKAYENADVVLIFFPLYTDCMPGIVKEFFEHIVQSTLHHPKKIGFVVQSGFPESIHSVYVEHYLKKLTNRLNCLYLGTVIKGGVEGIQIMPEMMTRKLFNRFQILGEYFAVNSIFSPEVVKSLRKPYKMSPLRRSVFRIMMKTGLANFYWNSNLKQNGAYNIRFNRPYS